MFLRAHWLIASATVHSLPLPISSHLHFPAFCLGSILPDLLPPFNQVPHNFNKADTTIRGFIQQIEHPSPNKQFANSLRLGMLTHFISDYFCSAHNKAALSRTFPHLVYEVRLDALIRHQTLSDLARQHQNNSCDISDPLMFIDALHQSYLKEPTGLVTDLSYVMRATTTIMRRILSQEEQKQLPEAA